MFENQIPNLDVSYSTELKSFYEILFEPMMGAEDYIPLLLFAYHLE